MPIMLVDRRKDGESHIKIEKLSFDQGLAFKHVESHTNSVRFGTKLQIVVGEKNKN